MKNLLICGAHLKIWFGQAGCYKADMAGLGWYVTPIWKTNSPAGIGGCSQIDRRPKSGKAFNWFSQVPGRSVLFDLQTSYLQTFGENGEQEMAFAKSWPRFLWKHSAGCNQLMPQSRCPQTSQRFRRNPAYNGHWLGPWTWLESNAGPLSNELLTHSVMNHQTTSLLSIHAEYVFQKYWFCIWEICMLGVCMYWVWILGVCVRWVQEGCACNAYAC